MKKYGIVLASSLLSAILAIFIYRLVGAPEQVVIHESPPTQHTGWTDDPLEGAKQRAFLSSSPTNFIAAAAAVTPGVVNIRAAQSSRFDLWGSEDSYGSSSGSGVIISADGFIVTNHHVIQNANEIQVTLNDKREFNAEIVGIDPSTDLALLKIKGSKLHFLQFGNSDSLRVGEWVLAVGNPFELQSTVTAGIVSARGRSIDILETQDRIESFIQTDAAVNPGNSGGALVNTNGELVGINTAIITRSGRYEGYSFAVPGNLVRKVIKDLRDHGVVQRGILGVFIDDLTEERARQLGLPSIEGVYITRTTPGGAAEKAGLREGDVVISINGKKTQTLPEMQEQLGSYRPNNVLSIEYIRNGKKAKASATLQGKVTDATAVNTRDDTFLRELGFELRDLNREEQKRLNVKGVRVVSIFRGSKVERTNMDPGFVITRVNSEAVTDLQSLSKKLKSAKGKVLLEGIYEDYAGEYYYAFSME